MESLIRRKKKRTFLVGKVFIEREREKRERVVTGGGWWGKICSGGWWMGAWEVLILAP